MLHGIKINFNRTTGIVKDRLVFYDFVEKKTFLEKQNSLIIFVLSEEFSFHLIFGLYLNKGKLWKKKRKEMETNGKKGPNL